MKKKLHVKAVGNSSSHTSSYAMEAVVKILEKLRESGVIH